ncbi:RsfS/YbeB/iojap family protein [Acidimicrobiaceae bacterium]|nr:RsfS/YbeB/iojap family protein [Acidimicrobiaceae bacterium]
MSNKIHKKNNTILDSLVDILLTQNIKDIKVYEPKSDVYSDFIVISTASSNTQMNSALRKIVTYLKANGFEGISEGLNSSWILLQSEGLSIHIFLEEARDYYSIEDLYFDGNLVNQYG